MEKLVKELNEALDFARTITWKDFGSLSGKDFCSCPGCMFRLSEMYWRQHGALEGFLMCAESQDVEKLKEAFMRMPFLNDLKNIKALRELKAVTETAPPEE